MSGTDEVVVVAETRSHSLLRDASGYAVWELASDAETPIAEFPLTDDGTDAAFDLLSSLSRERRHERIIGGAAWVVVGVGLVWLCLLSFLVAIGIVGVVAPDAIGDVGDRLTNLIYPLPALPTAFMVAIGIYVIVWTQLRSRRGRD